MRFTITILFTILTIHLTKAYGQHSRLPTPIKRDHSIGYTDDYKALLAEAKTLFKEQKNRNKEDVDYSRVRALLEKVIEINPECSEARYFLGYTYSRINSFDGNQILKMNLGLLFKTSKQFEKVIALTPKYTGDIVVLDPYSKLTSEWGSMALGYWYKKRIDSAVWAFKEGRKRGGFGNFVLELNKKTLDACTPNSILISSGDNNSFPLWYLQLVEKYRPDVSVIDVSLLNAYWYPSFLAQNKIVAFDLPREKLDTIEFKRWEAKMITIKNFSWTLKPSYYYILTRGDRIFLSLLRENKFQRDLYFTTCFAEESRLSLKNYLSSLVFVDKLSISGTKNPNHEVFKHLATKYLQLSNLLNPNSPDEFKLFDYFRITILEKIDNYIAINDKFKAKELMDLLDKFADERKYPYQNEYAKKYALSIRQKL